LIALVGIAVLALAGCEWTAFGYDLGNTRSSGDNVITRDNVAALRASFTGVTGSTVRSSPAIAKDVAYVAVNDGKLYAFDALGITGCAGSPKTCDPLWTADLHNTSPGDPTVADGRVFVQTGSTLFAFDAAGSSTRCMTTAGVKTCLPLWQHNFASSSGVTSDAIVENGVVYLTHQTLLYAFDAAGCPSRVCTPKWTASGVNTASDLAPPAFANGRLYVGGVRGSNKVSVFDVAACSAGSCTPVWTTSAGGGGVMVAGGRLYSGGALWLYAFDANGNDNCPVSPSGKVCSPLWRYPLYNGLDTQPAIANGIVYTGTPGSGITVPILLGAFRADGSGCTGVPRTCGALWKSSVPGAGGEQSAPAVANGLVFVGSKNNSVYAFAAGGCSASVCAPLWSRATNGQVESSPAVSNGRLVVGTLGNSLYVFK
jgi:hypothetical protein